MQKFGMNWHILKSLIDTKWKVLKLVLSPNYYPALYISNICRLKYNQGTRRPFSPYVEATNKALSPLLFFFDCLTLFG